MDRVVSVGCKSWLWVVMLCGGCPPEYRKKLPPLHARPASHRWSYGFKFASRKRPEQLANARRSRSWVKICLEPRVGGDSGSSMAAFAKSWRREWP